MGLGQIRRQIVCLGAHNYIVRLNTGQGLGGAGFGRCLQQIHHSLSGNCEMALSHNSSTPSLPPAPGQFLSFKVSGVMTHLEAKYVVSAGLKELIIFLLAEPKCSCSSRSRWVTILWQRWRAVGSNHHPLVSGAVQGSPERGSLELRWDTLPSLHALLLI